MRLPQRFPRPSALEGLRTPHSSAGATLGLPFPGLAQRTVSGTAPLRGSRRDPAVSQVQAPTRARRGGERFENAPPSPPHVMGAGRFSGVAVRRTSTSPGCSPVPGTASSALWPVLTRADGARGVPTANDRRAQATVRALPAGCPRISGMRPAHRFTWGNGGREVFPAICGNFRRSRAGQHGSATSRERARAARG